MRKTIIILLLLTGVANAQLGVGINKNSTLTGTGSTSSPLGVNMTALAGNGITNSSATTFDVGAGTGISVGANTVSVDTSVIQAKITGTCTSPAAITAVNTDGTVTCSSTAIDGTGTANTLAKWSDANTLANTLWTDDGATTAYNTNKFTVAAASGDAAFGGTITSGSITSTGFIRKLDSDTPATYIELNQDWGGTNGDFNLGLAGAGTDLVVGIQGVEMLRIDGDDGLVKVGASKVTFDAATGRVVQAYVPTNSAAGSTWTATPSALASDVINANFVTNGSVDATAAGRTVYGSYNQITTTRSAGANAVTNIASLCDSSGAQTNLCLYTANGDNWFNVSGGSTIAFRNFLVNGSSTLGNDGADTLDASGRARYGDTASTSIDNNIDVFTLGNTGTGQTSDTDLIDLSHSGSVSAAGGARTTVGLRTTMTTAVTDYTNEVTTIAGRFESAGITDTNYGVYALATSPSGCGAACVSLGITTAYAIYANTTGGGINYAAFLENGMVAIGDTVFIGQDKAGSDDGDEALYIESDATGLAFDYSALSTNAVVTLDATAAARASYGVLGGSYASRSAGANDVTNYGLWGDASGGQVNYALYTEDGNVLLNGVSGTTSIKGDTSIGDNVADSHTMTGALLHTVGGTPTTAQYRLRETGGNAVIQLFAYAPDNVSLGFDVEWASSAWVARDATVSLIYKTGDQLKIQGNSGLTPGGSVGSFNTFGYWDLTSGALVQNNGAVINSTLTAADLFTTTDEIAPAQLTGNVNNYAPTGIGTATVMYLSADAAGRQITGITSSSVPGRHLWIVNTGSSGNTVVLVHQSGSSSAANQMTLRGGANVTLDRLQGVHLMWSTTLGTWVQLGTL